MKALVFGGAGFIGSHVVDALLEAHHAVTVVDDFSAAGAHTNALAWGGEVQVIADDICFPRPSTLDAVMGNEVFFHLAAKLDGSPDALEQTNITATRRIFEYAANDGALRFVYASSAAIFGLLDAFGNPATLYGATKLGGEFAIRARMQERLNSGMQVPEAVALRLFNVYGPRQRTNAAIARFIRQMRNGESLMLHGDGSQRRDFVFVRDVADAIVKAGTVALPQGVRLHTIEIGSGMPLRIETVAEHLLKRFDFDMSYIERDPSSDYGALYSLANTALADAILNWRASTPLGDGIEQTIRWHADEAQRVAQPSIDL